MAKAAKITGYSTKIKSELEEALGLPVTGKPRSPKKAAPCGSPQSAEQATASSSAPKKKTVVATATASSSSPSPPVQQLDYLQVKEIYEDTEIVSLILLSDVEDLEKFKEQARLSIEEREREADADFDYVELVIKKRKRFLNAPSFIEYQPQENIRYSIVVFMN